MPIDVVHEPLASAAAAPGQPCQQPERAQAASSAGPASILSPQHVALPCKPPVISSDASPRLFKSPAATSVPALRPSAAAPRPQYRPPGLPVVPATRLTVGGNHNATSREVANDPSQPVAAGGTASTRVACAAGVGQPALGSKANLLCCPLTKVRVGARANVGQHACTLFINSAVLPGCALLSPWCWVPAVLTRVCKLILSATCESALHIDVEVLSWQGCLCPVLQATLQDPVICSDGHTYERAAIAAWLVDHDTSPVTNEKLPHKQLIPNHGVRAVITTLHEHPSAV